MSTIFAPASGTGRAAVTIIRVSGPACRSILEQVAGPCPAPRRASLRRIRSESRDVLDVGLVLFLPGPGSYTGEDCAEFQVHGGLAVVRAVCARLSQAGARPAEAGEFTRRAFLNGRMDLLEAEGVADLIAAETEAQRKQALDLVDGRQSAMVAGWAETLRHALAWQEALIDFPDEDLPETVEADMLAGLQGLAASLKAGIADGHRGARVREGVRMVVTGPPNAGKSTLVNALAKRDVAITAASPGTTRDALEVWIEIAGHRVCLIDTAGLRDTDDAVEAEGVRRARAHAARADVVIRVEEAGSAEARRGDQDAIVAVANKVDLAPAPFGWLGISATTGLGMDALGARLQAEVLRLTDGGPHPALSHVRHEAALREALQFIEQAIDSTMPELRGEALRLAMRALGRISGAIGVEDILDTVFGSFCIGK